MGTDHTFIIQAKNGPWWTVDVTFDDGENRTMVLSPLPPEIGRELVAAEIEIKMLRTLNSAQEQYGVEMLKLEGAKEDLINRNARHIIRFEKAERKIEFLQNDLADALDLKHGKGPTALGMVVDARNELQARLNAIEAEIDSIDEWMNRSDCWDIDSGEIKEATAKIRAFIQGENNV